MSCRRKLLVLDRAPISVGGGGIGTHILFLVNIIVVNSSTRVGKGYRVLEWDKEFVLGLPLKIVKM
jgi:hypothetical protein